MSKRLNAQEADPVVRELDEIKKLLILDLFSRGVKPNQIAKILGVDKGNFSRAYPMREILGKPAKKA
jgi:hypothetical protein